MKKVTFIIITIILTNISCFSHTKAEADSLHQLGKKYFSEGNIQEGRRATLEALEIRKELFGEINEDYITSLNNIALSYFFEDNLTKAMELQSKVLELCNNLPQQHQNIGMYTTNMGRYCYVANDTENAITHLETALPIVEKYGEEYVFILNVLRNIYFNKEDVDNLNRIMTLADECNENRLNNDECNDSKCLLEKAMFLREKGNYKQANEVFLKLLQMPLDNETKVDVYIEYAKYFNNQKEYSNAAEYYLLAANIQESLNPTGESFIMNLYQAAINLYFAHEYKKSITLFQKITEYYSEINSIAAQQNCAKCYTFIADCYNGLKEHSNAKEYYLRTLDFYKKYENEQENYGKTLYLLADTEKYLTNYDTAVTYYEQAIKIFREKNMQMELNSAVTSLSTCYSYMGKEFPQKEFLKHEQNTKEHETKEAQERIKQELNNLELYRTFLGEYDYAKSLATIAGSYTQIEDYVSAIDYYAKYLETIRECIKEMFSWQSESERMTTWKQEIPNIEDIENILLNFTTDDVELINKLTSLLYDTALLSKGILLNSFIEFKKVLNQYGSNDLKILYEEVNTNEEEISRLRITGQSDEDFEKAMMLQQENRKLLLQLYDKCAEYADFTDYISYDWKDVQSKLSPTDVAIEFIDVNTSYTLTNEQYIVALVLTSDFKAPMFVPICTIAEAKIMADYPQLYEIDYTIWGNMMLILEGKKRIYFSADNILHNIGIEYLKYGGQPLSEKFEVYRLSSTKELCYNKDLKKPTKAALFGDISYIREGETTSQTQEKLLAMRGDTYADLSNTKREITNIKHLLEQNGVDNVSLFRNTEANKKVFLELDNSNVELLHIATHGANLIDKTSTETSTMDNCILALSGINLDTKEGSVTASEIADMNLRNCQLAVLSACQTGLGKLGSDGVFGLQRGFKNAGVKTLLISLSDVYDDSTADLMIAFYRNLMSGQTKREALVNAQKELKNNGFDDPKHWASFILLDALE